MLDLLVNDRLPTFAGSVVAQDVDERVGWVANAVGLDEVVGLDEHQRTEGVSAKHGAVV